MLSSAIRSLSRGFRGVATFHTSPSTQPGFLIFNSLEELKRPQLPRDDIRSRRQTAATPSSKLLESLKPLIAPHSGLTDSLALKGKGALLTTNAISKIQRRGNQLLTKRVRSYFPLERIMGIFPNQNPTTATDLLKLRVADNIFLAGDEELLNAAELELVSSEETGDAMECTNVLKKRRRRMRGHKHKKRLKQNRHKADK